jgi:hypothetical protein
LVGGKNAGRGLGEVRICTSPGSWEMVGAATSKQCCSKQRCSLGAAQALGAVAIATAAAAVPNKSAVWCIQSRGFGLALLGSRPIGLYEVHGLIHVVALSERPLQLTPSIASTTAVGKTMRSMKLRIWRSQRVRQAVSCRTHSR